MEWKPITSEETNKLDITTQGMVAGNGVIVRTIVEGDVKLMAAQPVTVSTVFVPHSTLMSNGDGTYRIEFKA